MTDQLLLYLAVHVLVPSTLQALWVLLSEGVAPACHLPHRTGRSIERPRCTQVVGELGLNAVISAGAVVFAALFMLPSLASSVMRHNLFHVLVNLGQSVSGYASALCVNAV